MDHALLPNIYHFISGVDPFDKLPKKLRKKISRYITISYLAKGERIDPEQLAQGYLYIIRTGAVEQLQPDGAIRARLGEADVFGFTMVMDHSEQKFEARALENTLLYMLPSSRYEELCKHPKFAANFATQYRARLKSALAHSLAPDDALLLQKVKQFCNREITRVSASSSIRDVAQQMSQRRHTSAVVIEAEKMVGFVSDRNLTKRVIAAGADTALPIKTVMTIDPPSIDVDDIVLKAVATMMHHSVRNLPVMDGQQIAGVVNVSDLVQNHTAQAVYLIDAIHRQDTVAELAQLMAQRQLVFEALVGSEIRPQLVAQVMTMIADALTARLIELAELKMLDSGAGKPPCSYAWMAAGSQARFEMQMVSDQDNALVLADAATSSDRDYFKPFAEFVCTGLAQCGYILCPGDIMASKAKWCQPLGAWKQYYLDWITHPESEALLSASVFMDIRCVHGDATLVKDLQSYMTELAQENLRFINMLVINMLRKVPPIGFFRTFVLKKNGENKNTLNIKNRAVNPVVDLARIYGLVAGSNAANTHQRLHSAMQAGLISQASHDDLVEAYNFICAVRLRYQFKAMRNAQPINNHLPPKSLSQFERNHLKEAFWIVTAAQEVAKQKYLATGMLR